MICFSTVDVEGDWVYPLPFPESSTGSKFQGHKREEKGEGGG